MRATRAATPGRMPRTRSRRPTTPGYRSTTSASGRPGSIHSPRYSAPGAHNGSGGSKNCPACSHTSTGSWSAHEHAGGQMNSETYYSSGNEVQLFEQAFTRKIPVMLTGPTGCGKTRFVEHMGSLLGRPVV